MKKANIMIKMDEQIRFIMNNVEKLTKFESYMIPSSVSEAYRNEIYSIHQQINYLNSYIKELELFEKELKYDN